MYIFFSKICALKLKYKRKCDIQIGISKYTFQLKYDPQFITPKYTCQLKFKRI